MTETLHLRPYRAEDEDALIALWQATWQHAYPAIDFAARVNWWRERWRGELVPKAAIIVAEQAGAPVGFVTIDASGYLDQLVVAPDHWGSELATALVDEAKRRSPDRITLLGQPGQRPRHPLLRTQRICTRRRGCQSDFGTAGVEDGVEGRSSLRVSDEAIHPSARRDGLLREACPPRFADPWRNGRTAEHHTPSNCSLASRA